MAFDQHAATTVAAVLLPAQRTSVLHTLTSDSPTILRFVDRPFASRSRRVHVGRLAVAGALVALFAALAFRNMWRTQPLDAEIRLQIVTPSTRAPFQFALSPDGRSLVFVASGNGPQRLWLRALDSTDAGRS